METSGTSVNGKVGIRPQADILLNSRNSLFVLKVIPVSK